MWSTFSLLSLDDDSDFDVYDETVSMIKALSLLLREKKPSSSPRVRVKTQETATTSTIASHDGDERTTERRERERDYAGKE